VAWALLALTLSRVPSTPRVLPAKALVPEPTPTPVGKTSQRAFRLAGGSCPSKQKAKAKFFSYLLENGNENHSLEVCSICRRHLRSGHTGGLTNQKKFRLVPKVWVCTSVIIAVTARPSITKPRIHYAAMRFFPLLLQAAFSANDLVGCSKQGLTSRSEMFTENSPSFSY
jgi:hypothetical protein